MEDLSGRRTYKAAISDFTLAFLEDTGWYGVDFLKAEPITFGKTNAGQDYPAPGYHAGCSWVETEHCRGDCEWACILGWVVIGMLGCALCCCVSFQVIRLIVFCDEAGYCDDDGCCNLCDSSGPQLPDNTEAEPPDSDSQQQSVAAETVTTKTETETEVIAINYPTSDEHAEV